MNAKHTGNPRAQYATEILWELSCGGVPLKEPRILAMCLPLRLPME